MWEREARLSPISARMPGVGLSVRIVFFFFFFQGIRAGLSRWGTVPSWFLRAC